MDSKDPQNALIKSEAYEVPEPYRPPVQRLYDEVETKPVVLDYWRILVKRKWMIFASALAVTAAVAIKTWTEIPIYRATATILIDPEQVDYLPYKDTFQQEAQDDWLSGEYIETQIRTIKSLTLATRVIKALNLESHLGPVKEESPSSHSKIYAWVMSVISPKRNGQANASNDPAENQYSPSAPSLSANLQATPVRGSRLIQVSFSSPDPALTATVANTVCAQYIEYNMEARYRSTQTATEFLTKQLVDLKANVEKSEEELLKFGQQMDIVTLDDKGGNAISQKLIDLNTALTHAQMDRLEKESTWRIVQDSLPGFPDSLRSPGMTVLENSLAQLQQEEATLSVLYKPGWPDLARVQRQREEVERQLVEARKRAVKDIENDYSAAVAKETTISQAVAAQAAESMKLSQNSIQYNILKREVETNQQLYNGFLQRLKEAGISAGLKSSNIRILDAAVVPGTPETPDKPRSMFYGVMGGLFCGMLLAFFFEYLDSSVKSPDDVDRFIKLPTLGVIPSPASLSSTSSHRLLVARGNNGLSGASRVELVAFQNVKSIVSEAYRNTRTSVLLSSGASRRPKSLLITSSWMGEGKTTTSLNLAITLCQTGEKVLLLDCDMRNPNLHRILDLGHSAGMSEYLSGNADLSGNGDLSPLVQETSVPNLYIIPGGHTPPNPAELLGSERMKDVLALSNGHFDHIVIDSPPVLSVADARILAPVVDGVILVIKGGETPKQAVQRCKRLLQEVNANIIGTVLNCVDVRSADYLYYSRYYYRYGYYRRYGYGSEKDAKESPPRDS
jgi:capsular exopolysaccharide synthesis family protein